MDNLTVFRKMLEEDFSAGDFEKLWNDVSQGLQEYRNSKEVSSIYILSLLERKNFEEENSHGILGMVKDLNTAIKILDEIKYNIERAEFLDDFDASTLISFMKENEISMIEMSTAISIFAVFPDRVFDRIEGKDEEILFNYPDNNLIEKKREGSKVCFIICTDNNLEYARIMEWIQHLYVPHNIEIDSIQVTGVEKLSKGYNEALEAVDAEYKIYLREGVRILNPYFLYRVIDAFEENEDIAMVGILGSRHIPANGIMEDIDCQGLLAVTSQNETVICGEALNSICDVSFVSNVLVATKGDIKWNTGDFDDEYCCSIHAMDLRREGKRVVVLPQEAPWILYDLGTDFFYHEDEKRIAFLDDYIFEKNKKHMLLCLGASSLVEMENNGIDKLLSNLSIIDENKDKIQLFITYFPEDKSQWMHVNNNAFWKIEEILKFRNVIEGKIDKEFLERLDAYYGDASPYVLKMTDLKKPVMIRSAEII